MQEEKEQSWNDSVLLFYSNLKLFSLLEERIFHSIITDDIITVVTVGGATATVFLPYKIPVYILQTYTLPIQYQIPLGGLLNMLWGTVCPGVQWLVVVPPGRHLRSQNHCIYFHVLSDLQLSS